MTVKLKKLFIGKAAGEIESQEELFKDMFYKENRKYDEITNNWSKFIISGPKGSGKTILSRYIKKIYEEEHIQCEILKSDSITLNKLINIGKTSLDSAEVSIFYKWFILIELSKIIFSNKYKRKDIESNIIKRYRPENIKAFKVYSEAYDELKDLYDERFTDGNYESSSINVLEQINSLLASQLEVSPHSGSKVSSRLDYQETFKEEKSLILKPYFKMISQFEEKLLICMKYHKVVLILDDIDEMKVKLDIDEESRNFLESLITTLKELNSTIKERNLGPNKCILLLRSDILSTLNKHSSNLNKILVDSQVELYWLDKDNKYPEKHILMDMLFHKIKLSCEEYKDLSNNEIYYKLFPQKINNKSATNYLLDYSFGRPRDIIFYLGAIQKRFPEYSSFSPSSFVQCENEYSNLLKNELLNELSLHLDIDYVEELFKLISDFKQLSFYYKDIKKHYEYNEANYPNIKDIKKSIADLYTFGIIGNSYRVTDNSSDSKSKKNDTIIYSWAYRRDGANEVNYNQQLSVHYGLRSSLGLKKRKVNRKNKKKKK